MNEPTQTATPRIISATETGTAPENREQVGDRIIKARITIKVDGAPTTCFLHAEEYNSDDVLPCEACGPEDGDRQGPGCDKCQQTGYADANAWSVALGATPEAAQEAHTYSEDEHYVAPCWCGNEGSVESRADWLAEQAEDAGLVPYKGDDEDEGAVEINAELLTLVCDLRDFMALEEGDGADKEGRDMRKRMDATIAKAKGST